MLRRFLLLGALIACHWALSLSPCAAADDRPNIIVIMADDMGYSDIGCFGGEIQTPALDSLAAGGVRFTQFYNTARCCPTRAALLTGLYPHQTGIGHMMDDKGHPGYRGDLNEHCVTIAQVLRTAGYATYMSGKWHVTKKILPDAASDKHNWPLQRGFDRFFGTIHGAGSFYDPNSLTRDNELIPPGEDFYYTDEISENAAEYIREHGKSNRPFFLYVAYTAPHWPMHALPEDIAKYKGVYDAGWDKLREQRFARMRKMGILDSSWELSERDDEIPPWEETDSKEWHLRCMEVYAAMVDRMDQGISQIVEALRETDTFDDTLILFLADNGGCAEELGRRGEFMPRPDDPALLRPMQPGELQFDMIPKVTRDGYPVRQGHGVMPGPADTFIAYGRVWANASNTPFRLYKHFVHEGGISSPLIAHWPQGIPRGGQLERQSAHVIDIMATCVDLADAEYPLELDGRKIHPLEGRSLLPAFAGDPIEREAIYWEHEGNRAIRVGDWKLVAVGRKGPWELYNLRNDRSELYDLAADQPERVQQMSALWQEYAKRTKVLPWPN